MQLYQLNRMKPFESSAILSKFANTEEFIIPNYHDMKPFFKTLLIGLLFLLCLPSAASAGVVVARGSYSDGIIHDPTHTYDAFLEFVKTNPETKEGQADSVFVYYTRRLSGSKNINGKKVNYTYTQLRSVWIDTLLIMNTLTKYNVMRDGVLIGDSIKIKSRYAIKGKWMLMEFDYKYSDGTPMDEPTYKRTAYDYIVISKPFFDDLRITGADEWKVVETNREEENLFFDTINTVGPDSCFTYPLGQSRKVRVYVAADSMTVSILEKARIAEQYVFSTKGYKSGEGNVVYNYDDNNKFRWNMAIYPINSDNRRMLFYKSSAGCMLAICDKKGNIIWESSISTNFERCINLAKVRNILKESASFDSLFWMF